MESILETENDVRRDTQIVRPKTKGRPLLGGLKQVGRPYG